MAYTYTCANADSEKIPYYSNPDVYYWDSNGVPYATGSAEANNALAMKAAKYGYSSAGSNCADGTATERTEVTNQCTWGDDWNEQPVSQCCCLGNLYASWWKYDTTPNCAMDVPGYKNKRVDYGHKMGVKLRDCKNLLGESISPYNTCALGKNYHFKHKVHPNIFLSYC